MGQKCCYFGVDNSSSIHIDNKKKYILVLGKGSTQGLDDAATIAEAENSVNFSRSAREFCLSLHYNGNNIFLFVSDTKTYQFKAKNFKIKSY